MAFPLICGAGNVSQREIEPGWSGVKQGPPSIPNNNKPQLQRATPPHPRETLRSVLLAAIYVNLLDAERRKSAKKTC